MSTEPTSLNEAMALMFLNQPTKAEQKLQAATKFFDQIDDWLNRGRAHSKLGNLYLRSGHYAMALQEFDKALIDLTDETISGDLDQGDKDTFHYISLLSLALPPSLNICPTGTESPAATEHFLFLPIVQR